MLAGFYGVRCDGWFYGTRVCYRLAGQVSTADDKFDNHEDDYEPDHDDDIDTLTHTGTHTHRHTTQAPDTPAPLPITARVSDHPFARRISYPLAARPSVRSHARPPAH